MAQKYDILYVNFYTDGSAARKIAPAFPEKKPQPKPRAKKTKKTVVYFDPVAICSILVAAVLLIMMAVGLSEFQNARLEAQQMESYLQLLNQQNQQLNEQFAMSVDLEDVQKTALALGMVPQDQVTRVPIQLNQPPQQTSISVWDQFLAFLTNLFA